MVRVNFTDAYYVHDSSIFLFSTQNYFQYNHRKVHCVIKGAKDNLELPYGGTLNFLYNKVGNLPLMFTSEPTIAILQFQDAEFFQVYPLAIHSYSSLIMIINIFDCCRRIFYHSTTNLVITVSSGVRSSVRSLRTLLKKNHQTQYGLCYCMSCPIVCGFSDGQAELTHP